MAAEAHSRRTLELPAELSAPRIARAAVSAWLGGISSTTLDVVLLVVSELVTNAVKYGAAPISLLVERTTRAVTITVKDAGRRRPRRRAPGRDGGLGLHIVDAVCNHVTTSRSETSVSCRVQIGT